MEVIETGLALQKSFDATLYEQFKQNASKLEPPSLSERVTRMLSVNNNIETTSSYIIDVTLDWNKFPKKKDWISNSETITHEEELKVITKASFAVKPLVDCVHETMHERLLTLDIHQPYVQDMVSYFPHKELLGEMLSLYRSGEYWLSFALGITLFERAVGDLMLHTKQNIVDDPLLDTTMRELRINDILKNPELDKYLGEDVVFLIRCFTGPIQSMNLRNLLWHGFLGLNEFQPAFTSFLFALIFSVGNLESVKGRTSLRESLDVDQFMKDTQAVILDPNFEKDHLLDMVRHSFFIAELRKIDFEKAIDSFYRGEYYYTIALLLPLLEQSMRRFFGYVNNCPERIHCAETDIMYTTFDEMLDPFVDEDGNIPNLLYNEIGHHVLFALFDYLFWKDGPRIRDKIAHGIVNPRTIPKCIPQMILNSLVYLCYKYSVFPPGEEPAVPYHELYKEWYDSFNNYEPLFHPVKCLVKDMFDCHSIWKNFHDEFIQVRKSTERVQKEYDSVPLKMIDDSLECQTALQHVHDQILSQHNSIVLFHSDTLSQSLEYYHVSKKPVLPLKFTGKVGNCLSTNLNAVYVLRKIVFHTREFLEHIIVTYTEYTELINQRKGQKKHRQVVAKFLYNMDDFNSLIQIIMCQVQLLHLESFNEMRSESVIQLSEQFRHNCLGFVISLLSSTQTNRWDKFKRNMSSYMQQSIHYCNS
jgi:hypothetical protein